MKMNLKPGIGYMKSEAKTFLATTSIKGVPKILKSSSPVQKAMWLVAVLFGLTLCIMQLYSLFRLFLGYKVTTVIQTVETPNYFPDITGTPIHYIVVCQRGGSSDTWGTDKLVRVYHFIIPIYTQ